MNSREIEGLGVFKLNKADNAEKSLSINLFKQEYEVSLIFRLRNDGSLDTITPLMIEVANHYIHQITSKLEEATMILKNYYENDVQEMAEEGFYDYITIEDISDLSNVLKPTQILIKDVKRNDGNVSVFLGLIFQCDWDEDGFVIKYDENGNVDEIGTTDIIY